MPKREAEELDRHIGPNLTLMRLRCGGALVRTLLTIEEVAERDFPRARSGHGGTD